MDKRMPLVAVALVGLIAPRRLHRALLRVVTSEPDDATLRSWVAPLTRLAGAGVLGWTLWRHRSLVGYRPEDIEELGISEPESEPALTPGTRRHDIASVLYHAEDPQSASDIVDLSADTEWEMGRSTASATLYRMYNDDLVARQERSDDGSYEYWLTASAKRALETDEGSVEPDPFPT